MDGNLLAAHLVLLMSMRDTKTFFKQLPKFGHDAVYAPSPRRLTLI